MSGDVVPGLNPQVARLEAEVLERPQDGNAWARLGLTYLRMGQKDLALAVLRRAAVLGTSDSDAWLRLSMLLEDAGNAVDSLAAAREAVAYAPDSARMLVNLGTRLLDDGQPHQAILHLQKAVQLDPYRPEPIGVLGIAHYRALQFAAAAECLEKALRMDPEADPSAWAFLGVSLDETGRPQGAVNALETAVFMKADYGWAWARLGKALRSLGHHAEAVAAYEKAIGNAFAPSVVWWDMGQSAAEVADVAVLERACRGLRKLDARLATKLRRKLRSIRVEEPALTGRESAAVRAASGAPASRPSGSTPSGVLH
jgi:tetratricopeptide (TPR) repeat protein